MIVGDFVAISEREASQRICENLNGRAFDDLRVRFREYNTRVRVLRKGNELRQQWIRLFDGDNIRVGLALE